MNVLILTSIVFLLELLEMHQQRLNAYLYLIFSAVFAQLLQLKKLLFFRISTLLLKYMENTIFTVYFLSFVCKLIMFYIYIP